ncbi:MAG: mevalonate kinase [Methanosphaera sp.]|nr:mevalonate kinase [Methanosphaera sp.]
MKIKTFAPGKIILFGEHVVVYKKPAIAVAISRGVNVELDSRCDNNICVNIDLINYSSQLELVDKKLNYQCDEDNKQITDYVYEAINMFEFENGFNLNIDINMYLGVGLGSSATITVATIKALALYTDTNLTKEDIAEYAHNIEIKIQGAASPIDTAMSTYGGLIYIDNESKLNRIDCNMQLPLLVSNCEISANTGLLVESVRKKYEKYPEIIENIFSTAEELVNEAKDTFIENDSNKLANLININQGLLDALGVNTLELSDMIYKVRGYGATGSKLTGSGGGGCIYAYCPDNIDEFYNKISEDYLTFKCEQSDSGVYGEIITQDK